MSGPLDQSVTLADVFAVVKAKRVPLAPELAGYLTLEIAEGAQSLGGEVAPQSVFIGEEGTVALVRPKEASAGDAEASIRAILQRLLEASGSQTPALAAAARRNSPTGIPALVVELEAALIPVNRSAGRRALARLARETKRVTLGVGRNAPPPDRPAPRAAAQVPVPPQPDGANGDPFPDLELVLPRPSSPGPTTAADSPAAVAAAPVAAEPVVAPPEAVPEPRVPESAPTTGGSGDAVDRLLAEFEVSGAATDHAVSRELKAMVGLEATPAPHPRTPSGADQVEELLAMTEPSVPLVNVRRAPPPAREPEPPPAPRPLAPRPPPPAVAAPPAALPPPTPPPPRAAPAPQPAPLVPVIVATPEPAPVPLPRPPSVSPARSSPSAGPSSSRPGSERPVVSPGMPGSRPPPRAGSRFAKTVVVPQRARAKRIDRILTVLTLLVLAGGAVAIWQLKPGFFTGRTPEKVAEERQAAAAAAAAHQQATAAQQAARCRAALTISDVPANAEVLQRYGQAPVDIERMPVGARLEFVATAEGYAPKRSIVPAGAAWDTGPDGRPRFELAVQLDPTHAKPGGADPWPAGEPGSVVGGKGAPGTVHVVSTPRGAEMWLLVGAGPEAVIEPVRCEQDVEILVAGPTSYRKRLRITAAQMGQAPPGPNGAHAVKISAGTASK